MKKNLFYLFIVLFLMSCQDDNDNDNSATGKYSEGIFFVNEGIFQTGVGTISFFNGDSVEHNIFSNTNLRPLGNTVQSLKFHNDKGYIVVNVSNKIEVVQKNDFTEIATIEGLEFPRYITPIDDNKAYVTQWGDGFNGSIQIIDLNENNITGSINTGGNGAEKMAVIGNNIWVGHSGGYGVDSIITVIDPFNDNIIQTIETGYNPACIVQDNQGNVWVLCQGYTDWTTGIFYSGKLINYDPTDYSIIREFEMPSSSSLAINTEGNTLYYLSNGSPVKHDISSSTIDYTPILSGAFYYSMNIDKENNHIYLGDAKDFSSQGEVHRFNFDGTPVDTLTAGIIPTQFVFEN